eukprot:scaffold8150_cov118-Cylindrotheca_fusiformis.AAC.4
MPYLPEDFLQQWSNRLVITLIIVACLDYWHRTRKQNGNLEASAAISPRKKEVDTTERNHRPSRLLDELEKKKVGGNETNDATKSLGKQSRASGEDVKLLAKPAKNKSAVSTILRKAAPNTKSADNVTSESNGNSLMQATTNDHPGMKAFHHWQDVETSLFRIYTLGRNDGVQVVPPYVPHSYRGTVPIFLDVTNATNIPMKVFWVNFQGRPIFKGDLGPDHRWTQTTWIDHPWVFEHAETQEVLLYYIPYRVIPTSGRVNTVSDDGTGQHKFSLVPPKDSQSPYWISVKDNVLPFPAVDNFGTFLLGITWTLEHMSRSLSPDDPSIDILHKYLRNIISNPGNTKYRRILVRSRNFAPIWQSALRGLLLAIGFVERGAFVELGCDQELPREWVQEVALLSYLLSKWKEEEQKDVVGRDQPEGYDGFGRQGFGRAGQMH